MDKKMKRILLIGTCVLILTMGVIYHYLKYTTRMSHPNLNEEWVCYQLGYNPTEIKKEDPISFVRKGNELYVKLPYFDEVVRYGGSSYEKDNYIKIK